MAQNPSKQVGNEASFVLVEKKGAVMIITLNRSEHGNAIRLAMYGLIADALRDAAKDDKIEAVVVTGKGKFFSTGADVAEAAERVMGGEGLESLEVNVRKYPAALTELMITFPKVLVAAVNGPVLGYPAGQLGLYDLVFVADSASLQVPFLQLGLCPEGCSSFTFPRRLGVALTNDLFLTGRTLTAAEMVSCGLASRLLPSGDNFLPSVVDIVATACDSSALSSIENSKVLLRKHWQAPMLEQHKDETKKLLAQFESGEPMDRFAKKFLAMKKNKSKL